MKSGICRGWLALLATLILSIAVHPSKACLRESLDVRGIQWSRLIVQAKLTTVGKPVDMDNTRNPDGSKVSYRLYGFTITQTLDGSAKTGDAINLIEYEVTSKKSPCHVDLGEDEIGKEYLLLLYPQDSQVWSRMIQGDPRPAALADAKAFIAIYMAAMADVGPDGLADAKDLIADTRKLEAQYTEDMARVLAQTLAKAADDTEAAETSKSLLEMGPQAIPIMQEIRDRSDAAGKDRLGAVIKALSMPDIASWDVDGADKPKPSTRPGDGN